MVDLHLLVISVIEEHGALRVSLSPERYKVVRERVLLEGVLKFEFLEGREGVVDLQDKLLVIENGACSFKRVFLFKLGFEYLAIFYNLIERVIGDGMVTSMLSCVVDIWMKRFELNFWTMFFGIECWLVPWIVMYVIVKRSASFSLWVLRSLIIFL